MAKIKGYKCYRKDRDSCTASGGVATFIKDLIHSEEIKIDTNLEAIVTKISGTKTFYICNIYIPNSQLLTYENISHLTEQLPKPVIILGDFNSHSHLWGSNKNDNRGKVIENLLDSQNFHLLNNGQHTHFSLVHGTFSAIDLSFCSINMAHALEWYCLPDLYDSDHFPINVKYQLNQITSITPKPSRWKINKADWGKYMLILNTSLKGLPNPNLTSPLEIDKTVNKFIQIITDAANGAIPKTKENKEIKGRNVPWWNKEYEQAIKETKHAFNTYKRNKTNPNLIHFKKCRAKSRYVIKSSKQQAWTNFVESINKNLSPKQAWDKINAIKGRSQPTKINSITKNDQTTTINQTDITNILVTTFANNSSNKNYNIDFLENATTSNENSHNINNNSDDHPLI